ncbi:MAG: site-specific integrase [Candidatus Obscuribacterales bacterium]|nr:site-specific integrase [Candidatus Obscuribacterales bacterium]
MAAKPQQRKFKFSKSTIVALQPPKNGPAVYYYDESKPGLALRVTANGVKTFCIYRWNPTGGKDKKGGPERVTLGKFAPSVVPSIEFETDALSALGKSNTLLTYDMAKLMADRVLGNLDLSRKKVEEIKAARTEMTLRELFNKYIENHAKKKRKTWEEMERCFDRWFGEWATRPISSLTRDDVEDHHVALCDERGPYAANRALEMIRAVYNKGIEWKFFSGDNPARGITEYEEQSRDRVLESSEFEAFFNSLNQESDQDIQDFVMLALLTGARKTNVLSMRWQDISFGEGTWRIRAEHIKNKKAQTIPLTEVEMEILQRRKEADALLATPSEFVFPGAGRTGHLVEPKKGWRRILVRAGIQNLHIHDLRRSLGSWMANTGANVALIQNALNHQDLKTTLTVYARTKNDAELAARQKAHAHIFKMGKVNKDRDGGVAVQESD